VSRARDDQWVGGALGVMFLCALLGPVACGVLSSPPPETAARDAYRAATAACRGYDLLPAAKHTADLDRVCRSLRLVCDAPANDGAGGSP
jgi:hypothetical protein